MADNVTTVERTGLTGLAETPPGRPLARLSWGGIFIGMFSTLALTTLLLSLGAAIGLTTISPGAGGLPIGIGTGLWAMFSFVVSTFLGAWIGTRASRLYVKTDAVAEGFSIWALSLLVAVVLTALLAGYALRTTTTLAAAALQAAANAAQAGGEVLSQDQIRALQQQIMGALPQAGQAQAAGEQAAETAATAGAAASWWYFVTALFSAAAGILGGLVGLKRKTRDETPIRQAAALRPHERPV